MMLRRVDERISVAPQIAPEDVADIAAAGFAMVVNNRPEDEEAGQPEGATIEEAARAAGLDYVAIPVTHAGFSSNQVEAMAEALAAARGPVLAFCRSGTRSCNLWALAEASRGGNPDMLTAKAAAAGYDLTGIRPLLDTLSGTR
jgi:uncharacterized protein (TIGR01244 family)